MNNYFAGKRFLYTLAVVVSVKMMVFCQPARDKVNGNLIQFNDNGFWCWFQDERAVVDIAKSKMIVASAAYGGARNGADDAVFFDLQTMTPTRYVLNQWSGNPDDHNCAGLIIRSDGKYLAMYDQHYENNITRYRIFDGIAWASEQNYDWRTKPGGIDYTIAYNNIYYLSAENKMYDFSRANHRSPNFLVSTDLGNTWTWADNSVRIRVTRTIKDIINIGVMVLIELILFSRNSIHAIHLPVYIMAISKGENHTTRMAN